MTTDLNRAAQTFLNEYLFASRHDRLAVAPREENNSQAIEVEEVFDSAPATAFVVYDVSANKFLAGKLKDRLVWTNKVDGAMVVSGFELEDVRKIPGAVLLPAPWHILVQKAGSL